ncbi:MlaD family protein [Bacteriovoracaceae bacterium]|nr:MlaD family protein [Bacteriovoracaceae bacterium]
MNELKVGFLTILAIASLAIVSLKLTQNQSGFGEYVEYKSYIENASGIFPRTSIKVAGINSGRIKSIQLHNRKALITFEILKKIKLSDGSNLKIRSVGFLGDKYIDLDPGAFNGERLPSGSLVEAKTGGGLEDLAKDASSIMKDVKGIVASLKESMEDENRQNVIKQIISNIKDFSEDAKKITKSLKDATAGEDSSLSRILTNIEKTSEQLEFETDRFEDGSLAQKLQKIGPILDKADKVAEDLRIMTADLKSGKGTLGRLMRDDEVVDQVSETLSSVNKLVNRINNIEADLALFTGFNSDSGNHTQFDVDIFPAPERFFRLGFAKNDFGPDGGTETTSTTGGVATTSRVVETGKIKFNLMIGRMIQNFSIRAGLIESTGGVGLDYHFPDYGSRFTMEMFDYREDIGPNLRVTFEVRMWNVFYTRLSGEDLISKADKQTGTISFGLRFTDQDLSSLLGLLVN